MNLRYFIFFKQSNNNNNLRVNPGEIEGTFSQLYLILVLFCHIFCHVWVLGKLSFKIHLQNIKQPLLWFL